MKAFLHVKTNSRVIWPLEAAIILYNDSGNSSAAPAMARGKLSEWIFCRLPIAGKTDHLVDLSSHKDRRLLQKRLLKVWHLTRGRWQETLRVRHVRSALFGSRLPAEDIQLNPEWKSFSGITATFKSIMAHSTALAHRQKTVRSTVPVVH